MSAQELLEKARNTPTVAFHKFVLLAKGREHDLFCFFEGTDSQYYSSRIKQYVKRNYHPIICGNKQTVINLYNHFKSLGTYKDYLKAFFIDKDFDKATNIENIYETPCYSVENFYTNIHTLKEILKNEFFLSEEDDAFKELTSFFQRNQEDFHESTLLFNSWYAALKKKKVETKQTVNVNLDSKLPKNFVCIKIGSIKSSYCLETIKSKFPDALEISEHEVTTMLSELKQKDLAMCLRGKFEIWFFYEFLKFVVQDANGSNSILKNKTKFNVDKSQILSQLSQYAITPNCLIQYLQKFAAQ